jgi:protein SCO1/2
MRAHQWLWQRYAAASRQAAVASLPRVSRAAIAALFATGLVALVVVIIAARGVSENGSSSAQPAADVHAPRSAFEGALLPKGVRAPQFALTDQRGRRVTMSEYRGRPVVVTFMYSHCHNTCPLQAQQIKGALDDLGHDLPALAISVDPGRDTPQSVDRFDRQQGVGNRIRWVLGSESKLRPLWEGFHTTSQTPQTEHLARFVLVDKRGFQRIGYPANLLTPENLAHDLRLLERE